MDEEFDQRQVAHAPIANAPWYFRLGRYLSKNKIRGGERLIAEARRRGYLDRLALYPLSDEVSLRVPLWRPCNQWDAEDVKTYESAFMRALADAVCSLEGDVTLIDCGADIGTVSAHLVSRCKNIESVIAFEPNPAAHQVLALNIASLRIAGDARNAAVGNMSRRGRLVHAEGDPSAHAMYIVPDEQGPIKVERVDDLGLAPAACVIKIDVEGTEMTVVAGAERTIKSSDRVLVAFEAHYKVCQRTGEDPTEIMKALLAIRPNFTFEVDTTPTRTVSAYVPFFDQVPATRVYNVIARSV
jgi:FkbM family methyltransferase